MIDSMVEQPIGLFEYILAEALSWACLQIAQQADGPSVLYILRVDAQNCVFHSTYPGVCTSHVRWNTQFWASALRKTESVMQNTLGKLKGTWTFKNVHHFKNWTI